MRNDVQKPMEAVGGHGMPRRNSRNVFRAGGFLSARSISNYMRIVSSGASNVASSVRSAGSSIVSTIADSHDNCSCDQVLWAGFDKLEVEDNLLRQVLLLGYRSGFQVWDVEQADDVRQLVSRHDGSTCFLQMLKKPIASKSNEDRFSDVRPLLVAAGDASVTSLRTTSDGFVFNSNGYVGGHQELGNENSLPTYIRFYSMRIQNYVHALKFRTVVFSVRCSPRVVAVSQAYQIHCFNSATLEREYTILTYPMVSLSPGSGNIGYGPLAVGTRWLAYSGNPVVVLDASRVSPQDVTPTVGMSLPPNGSLVAHYANESSKQLAAGLAILGDVGYKKLSKYYSELVTDSNSSLKNIKSDLKTNGSISKQAADKENAGMVIVRDIVSKSIIVQFRAHASPISALCFDPSGTLLVTASIHGHNVNVFKIMPSLKGNSDELNANGVCLHLYRLRRGITNAIIQDISFSDDSKWIMISSSRGTSHLYALSPLVGIDCNFSDIHGSNMTSKGHSSLDKKSPLISGLPITLSAISRIRNGTNSLKGAVSSAAAAATGKISPLSGAIASVFHNCSGSIPLHDSSSLRTKSYLLVFSPSGSIIQYLLHHFSGGDFIADSSGLGAISHRLPQEDEPSLIVKALQKWDVCHKRNRRDRGDTTDIYGDHASIQNNKLFQKGVKTVPATSSTASVLDLKAKLSAEETHQLYISEVELHMHETMVPLWSKPEICFQVMEPDSEVDCSSNFHGEVEIERISTRILEVRSRDLIPVSDYLQAPKFPNSRVNSADNNKNGLLVGLKSGMLEDGQLSLRSSCSSLECMFENDGVAQFPNGNDGKGCIQSLQETYADFVNNNTDKPTSNNQLECVNNDEGLIAEAWLKTVNNIATEDGGHG